jgi:hypothetical protein
MIHNPFTDLAAKLMRERASASSVSGNGAGGGVSFALERVAIAEKNLHAAREAARVAARHAGVDLVGLFSEGAFVARSTAERWSDDRYQAGKLDGVREMNDCMFRARGLDPKEERAKIDASIERERVARQARGARWNAIMTDAGWFDAVEAKDFELAGRIMAEMHDTLTRHDAHVVPRHVVERTEREHGGKVKATSEAILRAAARARSSGSDERPEPDSNSLAGRILEAGRKARRPTGSDTE